MRRPAATTYGSATSTCPGAVGRGLRRRLVRPAGHPGQQCRRHGGTPSYTADGWELQLGTNHWGHFVLATGLHDALAAAGNARVVSLTSVGHVRSPVVFDDPNFRVREYDPWLAYGQSKTANALFAVEGNRRWAGDDITVNAVHPGGIWTNLVRHLYPTSSDAARPARPDMKTVEQGAATTVLVATSPQLEGIGGLYFEDCNQALPYVEGGPRRGVAAWATDPEAAERLWDLSLSAARLTTQGASTMTTRFSAESTALEVVDGVDLSGKRAIVTGASSGIGVETARALAVAGAEVTLAVRDLQAGEAPPRTSTPPPAATTCGSATSTSPARRSSRRSSPTGPARCTSWSTTPASWPRPACTPSTAGSCSSAPTTWATSS